MRRNRRKSNDDTVEDCSPKIVHHHEHRAPTDDSIKLMIEMQEKAEKRILKQIHITDNSFNLVGIFFGNSNPMAHITLHIRFVLNNKVHTLSHEIPHYEWTVMDEYRKVRTLYEKVAFYITESIFKESDFATQYKQVMLRS